MLPHQRIVLCVDDDPDDQLLMLEAIRELAPDVRVATALNGMEGLQFIRQCEGQGYLPSLVIMDINMPLMDGKQAILSIKKEPAFSEIPLVIFTTSSSALDKAFSHQYGVHFMTKPIRVQDFKETVKHLLSYRTLE